MFSLIMNDYSQIVMETLTNQLYPSVHDKCLLILLDFSPQLYHGRGLFRHDSRTTKSSVQVIKLIFPPKNIPNMEMTPCSLRKKRKFIKEEYRLPHIWQYLLKINMSDDYDRCSWQSNVLQEWWLEWNLHMKKSSVRGLLRTLQ